jgi:hypothetical protein
MTYATPELKAGFAHNVILGGSVKRGFDNVIQAPDYTETSSW